MEEIEYLLLNNINISLLKEELLRYNMELKYTSITKNININNNYQLRLYCSNNEYYYIYLDGTNNFNCDNNIFFKVIKKEYIDSYIDYLISLRMKNIDMYDRQLSRIKKHILEEETEIQKLKKYKS